MKKNVKSILLAGFLASVCQNAYAVRIPEESVLVESLRALELMDAGNQQQQANLQYSNWEDFYMEIARYSEMEIGKEAIIDLIIKRIARELPRVYHSCPCCLSATHQRIFTFDDEPATNYANGFFDTIFAEESYVGEKEEARKLLDQRVASLRLGRTWPVRYAIPVAVFGVAALWYMGVITFHLPHLGINIVI